ncbi:MAG TPA: hypothetical protein VNA28_04815 [Solirubrobacteraceae bacterium]|nr:hypothetical protein [Solirubrobacteraceae bacterium]
MHLRRLALAGALSAAVIGTAPPGADASFARCDPPRTGLLVATEKVRVWRTGSAMVGCADGQRRRILVDNNGSFPPLVHILQVFPFHLMRPERLGVRGTTVAYGALEDVGPFARTEILAQDLARPVREANIDEGIFPRVTGAAFEFPVVVGGLAIGSRGEIAALICPRRGLSLAPTCLRPGALDSVVLIHPGLAHRLTLVAAGTSIDPASLRGEDTHFSWIERGVRRRAPFHRPAALREDCARAGHTVARSARIRLLRRALTGVAEDRAPLAACRLPGGRIHTLSPAGNHVFNEGVARVRPGNAVAGSHVAYETDAYRGGCRDSVATSAVAVTGADPSRVSHRWDFGVDLVADGALATPTVRRLYVTKGGSAVWSVRSRVAFSSCGSQPRPDTPESTWILAIDGRTGRHRVLAHDRRIASRSLRLRGHRASWRRGRVWLRARVA